MSISADLFARAPWGTWVITTPLAVLTVLGWYGPDIVSFVQAQLNKFLRRTDH